MANAERLLLSRKDAAQMLGVSLSSVAAMLKDGRLTGVRLARRHLVRVDSVQQLAQTGTRQKINKAQ